MHSLGKIGFGLAVASLIFLTGIATGCGTDPMSSELPRTPYGRYQDLRGGEPPQEELDSFGNSRPALRA
ncbi:MAG: hypothetical protein ACPGYV_09165, partial [Phycisphaeraceae bacterium]